MPFCTTRFKIRLIFVSVHLFFCFVCNVFCSYYIVYVINFRFFDGEQYAQGPWFDIKETGISLTALYRQIRFSLKRITSWSQHQIVLKQEKNSSNWYNIRLFLLTITRFIFLTASIWSRGPTFSLMMVRKWFTEHFFITWTVIIMEWHI